MKITYEKHGTATIITGHFGKLVWRCVSCGKENHPLYTSCQSCGHEKIAGLKTLTLAQNVVK
jgi:uncharacterized OB-fold protein